MPTMYPTLTPMMFNLNGIKANLFWLNDALENQKARFETTVRTIYSDTYLYVGFYCKDDYVWSTHSMRDSAIYDEECVEVFLNPASVAHQYYEINVSPRNVIFDACILNSRTERNQEERFVELTTRKVVAWSIVPGARSKCFGSTGHGNLGCLSLNDSGQNN